MSVCVCVCGEVNMPSQFVKRSKKDKAMHMAEIHTYVCTTRRQRSIEENVYT